MKHAAWSVEREKKFSSFVAAMIARKMAVSDLHPVESGVSRWLHTFERVFPFPLCSPLSLEEKRVSVANCEFKMSASIRKNILFAKRLLIKHGNRESSRAARYSNNLR